MIRPISARAWSTLACLSIGCVFASIAAPAQAQTTEFSANHVFASALVDKQILEFDEHGVFVRAIDLASGPNISPVGISFGPNGLLYVGSGYSTAIVTLDGTGEVQGTISNAAILNVEAVEFDTIGRPLVTSYNFSDLVRLSHDGSSATVLYDGSTQLYDLEIDDSGLLVTSAGALGHTKFFDVDGSNPQTSAASLALLGTASTPHGVAIEFGNTAVVSDPSNQRVVFGTTWYGSTPEAVANPLAGGDVEDVDFAPDGRLLVVSPANGSIVAVDAAGETDVFATSPNPATYMLYITVAPFRFDAIVRGRVRDGSGEMVQILESAVVSIQPASRRVMFQFTDDPLDPTDFVSVTGLDRFVTNGKVSGIDAPGPTRSIQARAPRDLKSRNDVTVTCDYKRKFDDAGFERVVSASGSLWCGGTDSQIHLTFKTKKVKNP